MSDICLRLSLKITWVITLFGLMCRGGVECCWVRLRERPLTSLSSGNQHVTHPMLGCLATAGLVAAVAYWRQRKPRLKLAVQGSLESHPVLVLRELCSSDVDRGFLDILSQLSKVGDVSHQRFLRRWRELKSNGQAIVAVVHDVAGNRILAAGTLLIEPKFIHDCSAVGHIEDVVVDSQCRGKKVGTALVQALIRTAQASSCYKVILGCDETNVPFYQKCSMRIKGVQMAQYFEE